MRYRHLPSGEWGYLHFPLLVNFHNRFNAPLVGMNGKFHLSWGDHGSLKNQQALEFEAFRMIANGCMVCVGDQLHPRGQMNHSASKRLGKVYETIEHLEPSALTGQNIDFAIEGEYICFELSGINGYECICIH